MRILDKYILKELFGPFFFGIAAFSSVIIGTSTLFRIAQLVTKYDTPFATVVQLFVYSLPNIIVLTFPMSMLLASLLAFGRLSGSSEIIAMKSGGLSFYRLATPVFIAAFIVSIIAIGLNEKIVPAANSAYNYIVRYEIEKNTIPKSQEHIIIKDIRDGNLERLTYARNFAEETREMNGITIQEFENNHLVRIENAERAIWNDDRWIMYNGIISNFTADGRVEQTLRFNEQIMPIEKNPASISREQKKPEEMSIKELQQHIKVLRREYVRTSEYEVEMQQRIAVPMASFIFSLIGTPLGLSPNRSSSSIGLGLSIVIIFIYYTIMTVFTALGQGDAIPAVLAAWVPNMIGVVAGGYLVWKASR
ncbi:MAG TPA: LptF/LptG family permease [Methylomusa anaerophila]|uniref:Lipopolysaccharide export system permease protein LptG n=1 Tax=Methylomusa anaerophila TaxID=1930071 RepID=A0A348AKI3_9FIRM|nr:LptF/LptG family permease [Methylomusa anaerophila]BBB91581.1 lipopolysaccharide export system permease protein LptG [Methylomusa anaerophila]HML89481.1 LptF/LptG family permease [Methylomusa anaerophila]